MPRATSKDRGAGVVVAAFGYTERMAQVREKDEPTAIVRRLLRDLRNASRIAESPAVELLCAGVPTAQRQAHLAGMLKIALHRLPLRQREIVRRYDLDGEKADEVQRAMVLSPRQFFRDRRAAITALATMLGLSDLTGDRVRNARQPATGEPIACRGAELIREIEVVRRTLARSLSQTGNVECVRVLRELAQEVREPAKRAEVLLDLADAATDYGDEVAARDAQRAVAAIVDDAEAVEAGRSEYLEARLARVHARLAETTIDAATHYSRAVALLRRSMLPEPEHLDVRFALAEVLGDLALLHFAAGSFTQARAASLDASELIETFRLWSRPRSLETLAMTALLDACLSGRTASAIAAISGLLLRAVDAGWCSTASRLGAELLGLNSMRGEYEQAIVWYQRITELLPPEGAKPRDETVLTMEAAHAYTMTGHAAQALSILSCLKRGNKCAGAEIPTWHRFAAEALERLGEETLALAQAHEALNGYEAQQVPRAIGDTHRLIALCCAKLGDIHAATDHVLEAQRLAERHATPYGLLRTLAAKAHVLTSAPLKKEAIDLALLLKQLGKSADSPRESHSRFGN